MKRSKRTNQSPYDNVHSSSCCEKLFSTTLPPVEVCEGTMKRLCNERNQNGNASLYQKGEVELE